ncbi:MAG: efflux RND transporter periplasmic adaptor subunit [Desulfobacterales bacterium]|nr:efflux RND transporter periplasmic adaptor subunit [Desulfobacterales bacterium]
MELNDIEKYEEPAAPRRTGPGWTALKVLLPLLILFAGISGANYIKKKAPAPRKRPPMKMTSLVEALTARPDSHQVTVSAMGVAIPAREMVLKARVSGEIIEMHRDFSEGGFLKKGERILRIDGRDYELAVIQKRRAVTEAEYNLKLELGRQDVARREWELLNGDKPASPGDVELATRKPHLEKARADIEAARAELARAQRDLDRAVVRAPFNAIVRATSVELGSQISAQEPLAELVGVDAYWIQASVPIDRLKWIDAPRVAGRRGPKAKVIYRREFERSGAVVKLLGDLAPEGRMARVLVEIPDPLDLKHPGRDRPRLLLGEYVRVEIQGRRIDHAHRIPRSALRDDNRLWIADGEDKLEIRAVDVIWRDADSVLVGDGLQPGDRVVTSDLASPAPGAPLIVQPYNP